MKRKIALVSLFIMCFTLVINVFAVEREAAAVNITVRDFKEDNILFDKDVLSLKGLVKEELGADGKPLYNTEAWNSLYNTADTKELLDALFNDDTDINKRVEKKITLKKNEDGDYVFSTSEGGMKGFFPIDNELWGNEGEDHNTSFTFELSGVFGYREDGYLEFNSTGDAWIFVDGKLELELTDITTMEVKRIYLDEIIGETTLEAKENETFRLDIFYMQDNSELSNVFMKTNLDIVNFKSSDWAKGEVFEAYKNNLIPETLFDEDLGGVVHRDEFAHIVVKLYEEVTGKEVIAPRVSPFTDTTDVEVIKAYHLGFVNGTSETTFSPKNKVSRQEAATMLTRVYKKIIFEDWTLQDDDKFALEYDINEFDDDDYIDDWAKEAVYYMADKKLIKGVGDNKFAPKNMTEAEEISGYANSTREQALAMALRSLDMFII